MKPLLSFSIRDLSMRFNAVNNATVTIRDSNGKDSWLSFPIYANRHSLR